MNDQGSPQHNFLSKLNDERSLNSAGKTQVDGEEDEDDDTFSSLLGVRKKSELFLTSTSVDDNGTFSCIASNSAGIARAEFTLHVVVPLDPPPPLVSKSNYSQKIWIYRKRSASIDGYNHLLISLNRMKKFCVYSDLVYSVEPNFSGVNVSSSI